MGQTVNIFRAAAIFLFSVPIFVCPDKNIHMNFSILAAETKNNYIINMIILMFFLHRLDITWLERETQTKFNNYDDPRWKNMTTTIRIIVCQWSRVEGGASYLSKLIGWRPLHQPMRWGFSWNDESLNRVTKGRWIKIHWLMRDVHVLRKKRVGYRGVEAKNTCRYSV